MNMTNQNTSSNTQKTSNNGKKLRGFAAMPKDKQRAIASKGGKAAHRSGNAHEWNSAEAKAAGRKGGQR
jgi:general stress protein YciG